MFSSSLCARSGVFWNEELKGFVFFSGFFLVNGTDEAFLRFAQPSSARADGIPWRCKAEAMRLQFSPPFLCNASMFWRGHLKFAYGAY